MEDRAKRRRLVWSNHRTFSKPLLLIRLIWPRLLHVPSVTRSLPPAKRLILTPDSSVGMTDLVMSLPPKDPCLLVFVCLPSSFHVLTRNRDHLCNQEDIVDVMVCDFPDWVIEDSTASSRGSQLLREASFHCPSHSALRIGPYVGGAREDPCQQPAATGQPGEPATLRLATHLSEALRQRPPCQHLDCNCVRGCKTTPPISDTPDPPRLPPTHGNCKVSAYDGFKVLSLG